jgi:hypothetical protein
LGKVILRLHDLSENNSLTKLQLPIVNKYGGSLSGTMELNVTLISSMNDDESVKDDISSIAGI